MITVDLGTATTPNAITEDGVFLGGAISPGVGISTEALFARAAKLPRIDLVPTNGSVIGKNTVQSMQIGIMYGYAGGPLVDGFRAEMGAHAAIVLATGGFARLISPASRTIEHVDPNLACRGAGSCGRCTTGVEQNPEPATAYGRPAALRSRASLIPRSINKPFELDLNLPNSFHAGPIKPGEILMA